MYPTATRYPGPANATIFRHHVVPSTGTLRYTSTSDGVARARRHPVGVEDPASDAGVSVLIGFMGLGSRRVANEIRVSV
jgi:hypothetical protein